MFFQGLKATLYKRAMELPEDHMECGSGSKPLGKIIPKIRGRSVLISPKDPTSSPRLTTIQQDIYIFSQAMRNTPRTTRTIAVTFRGVIGSSSRSRKKANNGVKRDEQLASGVTTETLSRFKAVNIVT